MTEQEIREKIINGIVCNLNFTTKSDCEQCRYNCEKTMFLSVPVDLLADILALLKAQETRVMTLDELKSCDRETIWFEVKSDHTMKQLTQDGIAALIFIGLLHNWNGCGTIWRCWTSRPTEAEREAAPWN